MLPLLVPPPDAPVLPLVAPLVLPPAEPPEVACVDDEPVPLLPVELELEELPVVELLHASAAIPRPRAETAPSTQAN
jgi:hypothetical protein